MKCSACGQASPSGARFCAGCGARVASACAGCGGELLAGARFCPQCGKAVLERAAVAVELASPAAYTPKHLAEKILTSKSALEGERKQVTVLFADVKGSMELLADRDPEEARKILDPVLELMMEAVHRYEGTVNQVMGDGIMALFGAPVAHEDHGVRACYAALRMQDAVNRYAEAARRTHGAIVQIRVGLNSGDVVVRAIGSDLHMDYTAVGETTHLAARMEQLARPGSVIIAPATLDLVEGFVAVKSLGPLPVKGRATPVEVYELAGIGHARTRLQAAARRGLTRFVGRDAEIDVLRRSLGRAGDGHGQLVAVVGEAGVGKSRLVYEFTHSHRIEGWLVLETASVSYGKATSYLPVIDLLRGYFKIQDRDDLREAREKVTGKVLTLDESLRPALPALLALLDVPLDDPAWRALDPGQRRQQTLDAVKRLLLREAQVQPLVVIFEDLHWIDAETQALLDALVESLGSTRVLLLVNYRPEYQHGWGSRTFYEQLRLDALASESAAALLGALLGDDPTVEPVKKLLLRRGNPFFLEESVRTLVETGALAGERGRYHLVQPVDTIKVPATVQAILAARIDRLSTEDKRLLQVASVIGKDVPLALLQAVADMEEDPLRRGLARLQSAEFLYETRLFPDVEYSFKHALTHDVAYEGVLHDRRRVLHARIVGTIEKFYPERLVEHAEQLAHHALRGEEWERAVQYSRDAGAKAFARSANAEALESFQRALRALQRLPESLERLKERIDLCFEARNCLSLLGELERIAPYLDDAERLARAAADQQRLGWVSVYMSNYLWQTGRTEDARRFAREAQTIGSATQDLFLEAWAAMNLGFAAQTSGDVRQAGQFFAEVVGRLGEERAGQRRGWTGFPGPMARSYLAWCLAEQGRFEEAMAEGLEALRLAEATNHPYTMAYVRFAVGFAYLIKGDSRESTKLLERSLALCDEWGVGFLKPFVVWASGCAHILSGRIDDGLMLLRQALSTYETNGFRAYRSHMLVHLGEASVLGDQIEEAREFARRALLLSRERGERGYEGDALRLLGELASLPEGGDFSAAETRYREARALAAELHLRPLVAHCHLGLGKLYRRTGNQREAQTHVTIATTMYREMGMTYWLEKAEAELT